MKTLKYYSSKGEGEPANPMQQQQKGRERKEEKFISLVESIERNSDVAVPSSPKS